MHILLSEEILVDVRALGCSGIPHQDMGLKGILIFDSVIATRVICTERLDGEKVYLVFLLP